METFSRQGRWRYPTLAVQLVVLSTYRGVVRVASMYLRLVGCLSIVPRNRVPLITLSLYVSFVLLKTSRLVGLVTVVARPVPRSPWAVLPLVLPTRNMNPRFVPLWHIPVFSRLSSGILLSPLFPRNRRTIICPLSFTVCKVRFTVVAAPFPLLLQHRRNSFACPTATLFPAPVPTAI